MEAGQLRERIRIQEPIEINDKGVKRLRYQSIGTFWAAVSAQKGTEGTQNNAVSANLNFEVVMRYQELGSKHRLIWGSKVLNLVGPPSFDPKKTQIVCQCVLSEGELPTEDFSFSATGGVEIGGSYGF